MTVIQVGIGIFDIKVMNNGLTYVCDELMEMLQGRMEFKLSPYLLTLN